MVLKDGLISGNLLKLIALAAMTADHIGVLLFPTCEALRIIGRLAFPIFAYMIAEGARYTKNRVKYLLLMLGVGTLCQAVYFITDRSLYMCVLITFSLSLCIIFAIDNARKSKTVSSFIVLFAVIAAVAAVCELLPQLITGFRVDYGFVGVMLPVLISLFRNRYARLALAAAGAAVLCVSIGGNQWWCLLALPLLALYNGKRGRLRLKYLFYIYYPLHLALLYFISQLL